jgi:hypothetical protein
MYGTGPGRSIRRSLLFLLGINALARVRLMPEPGHVELGLLEGTLEVVVLGFVSFLEAIST